MYDSVKLMYDNRCSFNEFRNFGKYSDISFTPKYNKMLFLYHLLNEFRNLMRRTEKNQKLERIMYIKMLQNHTIHC